MQANRNRHTFRIEQEAIRLGFLACGFARAEALQDEARKLETWLKRGHHGSMNYMEANFEVRTDPRMLLPGARTVITTLMNYYPNEVERDKLHPMETVPKIARYALGSDYHGIIRKRLEKLRNFIREEISNCEMYTCVDSSPFMDKAWAKRAGLGWVGKNTNLIQQGTGSWFLIGSIIVDIDLEFSSLAADACGTCRRCIDACPTDALKPYEIDGTRCISYLTIESKEAIPEEHIANLEGWAFGCDICQEVCPWNRFAVPHQEAAFQPFTILRQLHLDPQAFRTGHQFSKRLRDSPLSRIHRRKWLWNRSAAFRSVGKSLGLQAESLDEG